jgi:hypothetical protein
MLGTRPARKLTRCALTLELIGKLPRRALRPGREVAATRTLVERRAATRPETTLVAGGTALIAAIEDRPSALNARVDTSRWRCGRRRRRRRLVHRTRSSLRHNHLARLHNLYRRLRSGSHSLDRRRCGCRSAAIGRSARFNCRLSRLTFRSRNGSDGHSRFNWPRDLCRRSRLGHHSGLRRLDFRFRLGRRSHDRRSSDRRSNGSRSDHRRSCNRSHHNNRRRDRLRNCLRSHLRSRRGNHHRRWIRNNRPSRRCRCRRCGNWRLDHHGHRWRRHGNRGADHRSTGNRPGSRAGNHGA